LCITQRIPIGDSSFELKRTVCSWHFGHGCIGKNARTL
jgi:hypothetical protein